MKIDQTPQLDFKDVLIRPKRSTLNSRSEVNIEREFAFPYSSLKWKGVPIIAANMDTTGTFGVYDVLSKNNIITCLNKFYTIEDFKKQTLNPDFFMISTGIDESRFGELNEIIQFTKAKWICVDVANGYMKQIVTYCEKLRASFPDKIIVAGNVATREMVEELILNGKVDVVKVGIGPGSACLTRLKTGVGVPQLSAIIECADAAHGCGGYIIGDGGITCPGDMSKAFGGGADFVMVGGTDHDYVNPVKFNDAWNHEDLDEPALWRDAMSKEINDMVKKKDWRRTKRSDIPQYRRVIGNKWFFKQKGNGIYRARLVALGYYQAPGVDNEDSFSLVVVDITYRIIVIMSMVWKFQLEIVDVETVFLYGDLDEEIYMKMPVGIQEILDEADDWDDCVVLDKAM